jgi:hypothetical protein
MSKNPHIKEVAKIEAIEKEWHPVLETATVKIVINNLSQAV